MSALQHLKCQGHSQSTAICQTAQCQTCLLGIWCTPWQGMPEGTAQMGMSEAWWHLALEQVLQPLVVVQGLVAACHV